MNAFSRILLPVFLGLSLGSLVAADATPNQPLPEEAVRAAAAKIDALVAKVCEANGVKRNEPLDDEAFVRRIYLDLVGRVPSIAETRDFLESTYAAKRERLIESLLGTEGYVSHNYNYWADILRVNEKLGNNDATNEAAYRLWIKDALRRNKPYDQFVRELVSATGHVWENGAIGYYSRDRGMPLDNMANTVRIFLGTRLECAQCHNHPFDKLTQLDFYGMAAFSSGMEGNRYEFPNRSALSASAKKENGRARDEAMMEIRRKLEAELGTKDKAALREAYKAELKKRQESGEVAKRKEKGDESLKLVMNELYKPLRYTTVAENEKPLKLPHDYQYDDAKPGDLVPASTMFGAVVEAAEGGSKIQAYAEWMTSPENPTFTKVVVNRLWKRLFGHAIIEPLDELTDQSVSTNPELVAYLEELMKELHYDMRAFTGILANTSTYQRAATTAELEPGTPYYFQGPLLRRLSAEQVWDSALTLLIDHPDQYKPSLERDIAKIEEQKQIYESLEEIPFDEYQALVERLSVEIGDRSKVAEEKRKESIAARAAGDEEKAKELSREVREAQGQVEKTMKREAFSAINPGADKEELHAVFGVTDALLRDSILGEGKLEPSSDEMSGDLTRKERRAKMQGKAKKPAAKGKGSRKEAAEGELGTLARASEITARPGSFLRTFGQSDREVIENASDEATVPQALELLNGPVAAAVADPGSVLGRELVKAETPEAKITAIYTAMLSRPPKEKEVARILEEVASKGDAAYDDAVWAVLNSTQFLYIR